MSAARCSVCGRGDHVYLELKTDGPLVEMIGDQTYCLSCGSFIAGVIFGAMKLIRRKSTSGGDAD